MDKHLTSEERKALVAADPVLRFYEKVEKAALANPVWNANYAFATYRALGSEYRQYVKSLGVASWAVDTETDNVGTNPVDSE